MTGLGGHPSQRPPQSQSQSQSQPQPSPCPQSNPDADTYHHPGVVQAEVKVEAEEEEAEEEAEVEAEAPAPVPVPAHGGTRHSSIPHASASASAAASAPASASAASVSAFAASSSHHQQHHHHHHHHHLHHHQYHLHHLFRRRPNVPFAALHRLDPSLVRPPDGTDVCDSPMSSRSGGSMYPHATTLIACESPVHIASANAARATAEEIGRLSLEHGRPLTEDLPHPQRGRTPQPILASKRSASRELHNPGGRQSPRLYEAPRAISISRPKSRLQKRCSDRLSARVGSSDCLRGRTEQSRPPVPVVPEHEKSKLPCQQAICHEPNHPLQKTSPVCSDAIAIPATIPEAPQPSLAASTRLGPPAAACQNHTSSQVPTSSHMHSQPSSGYNKWPTMLAPPRSSPISQEQLAAEVKSIYAGLVMVEAKCISIDAAQAANPKAPIGPDHWQNLIALHRTLLYEHHDFLLATQHPSATQALRDLATKYSMPARMWKHGIHAFLEVLRHRRPDSQDYMLAFIYLAYQMMALLFETVPSFTDTWIECLGDLARYRMAIEEDRETHATWGGVAARWYTLASDRHPAIGRLYHHLGILERPSLRKFCLYTKSLTCVIPFPNARDSLSTLCGPIVQDRQAVRSSRQSAEARIVTYHALAYSRNDLHTLEELGRDALILLGEQPAKLRDFGAYLAITNIAALFELGSSTNTLWQLYSVAISQAMCKSRPSATTGMPHHADKLPAIISAEEQNPLLDCMANFMTDCFDFVLDRYSSESSFQDCLPYIHVSLVWLHSLHALGTHLNHNSKLETIDIPFDTGRISFHKLSDFLNTLAQHTSVTAHMLQCARQGVFLGSERKEDAKPLFEDYTIRGLIWGQFYFCPGWFDCQSEDDGRAIETSATAKMRSERVLWLGLYLAFHTDHLSYDLQRKVFSANHGSETSAPSFSHPTAVMLTVDRASIVAGTPSSRASVGTDSSLEQSEDGFQVVKKLETRDDLKGENYTCSAAACGTGLSSGWRRKNPQSVDRIQVVDEHGHVLGIGATAEGWDGIQAAQ